MKVTLSKLIVFGGLLTLGASYLQRRRRREVLAGTSSPIDLFHAFIRPDGRELTVASANAKTTNWGMLRDDAGGIEKGEVPFKDWWKSQRQAGRSVLVYKDDRDDDPNRMVVAYAFTVPEAMRVRDAFGYDVVTS